MFRIAFLGDISLNDEYRELKKRKENPFFGIQTILSEADFLVGNLECGLEGEEGKNVLKKPHMGTNAETMEYLNDIGINLVTLANNHVYDNLLDGFNKTISFLDSNGINYIGAGKSTSQASHSMVLNNKGFKISFLNYVSKDTNPCLPENCPLELNWLSFEKVVSDISRAKSKSDLIVLLLHWGGIQENKYFPSPDQITLAHKFIDVGADLIVGHHSHTLQPFEVYKGKYIFYSLGNFCFSDLQMGGWIKRWKHPRNTHSAILKLEITDQGSTASLLHTVNQNGHISPAPHSMEIYFKVRQSVFFILTYTLPLWQVLFPFVFHTSKYFLKFRRSVGRLYHSTRNQVSMER